MPKSVLITGCSGGIGSTLAKEFHAAGLHVYATARSKAKMTHLEHLENITLLELDVVSQASIEAAVEFVRKETETLDILVNNAGQTICMPALDVSIEEAKKIFDVNLWGTLAVTQAFAPMVVAAKGTIVNLCSISGILYTPWLGELKSISLLFFNMGEINRITQVCIMPPRQLLWPTARL